jgi:hypothetical protein
VSSALVQPLGLGPGRQLGDDVELAKELREHFTRVVSLAEEFDLFNQFGDGVFGLQDGDFGVVLALELQTLAMFEKFLAVKIGETTARRLRQRRQRKLGSGLSVPSGLQTRHAPWASH